uniref:Small ribosomal subunit protein uS15m n=1 Tax=Panstrongylus lignarius TaxID=156445 RepID=A0A224XTV7_9HEMI
MSIAGRNGVFLLRFMNFSIVGRRNLKSSLPIKWVRPEKIPCFKPEKSGDLKPLVEIDTSQYPLEFRDSEELKTADETVKRLFTLEYFPHNKTAEVIRATYLDQVKRHQFDNQSPEARVARMTANIRCMQQLMERFPKNAKIKVRLKETIDKRKKLLKFLRTWDYKCFEWILDRLDLIYKPFPPQDVYKRVERKRSLRMLTDKYCENIIDQKLDNYKESLEAQQEEFLEEKIKTLKWIIKEETDCGLDTSINEDDVKQVQDKLENLRKSRSQMSVSKQ